MATKRYPLGQTIRLWAELYDTSDQLTDTDGLRLLLFGPNDATGVVTAVSEDGEGKVYADVTPEVAGTWRYRFEIPSTGQRAAKERRFIVEDREVPAPGG